MHTYWHIAPGTYTPGDDLLCWDKLSEAGRVSEADWKWDEADVGTDGDVVCLFADTPQHRQQRDWMVEDAAGGYLLRVEIDEDDADVQMTQAAWEGYPAVVGSIPARCITVERAL